MTRRNYYCLIAGLPDIIHDDKKLPYSLVSLREYMREELYPKDFRLVEMFYFPFDNQNLLNMIFSRGKEWDERGTLTVEQLGQIISPKLFTEIDRKSYPDHILKFADLLHGKEDVEEKLTYDESLQFLTSEYYNYLLDSTNEFVRNVAEFGISTGNILLALNGRKHQLPFEDALIGNNPVTNAILKNRTRDFGLAIDFPEIEHLIQLYDTDNILERELKLDYRKWSFLDDITIFNYFSIERVLAFVLKIFMVERWFHLDYEKGQVMFNQLLKEIESSFEFPEEFTHTHGKKR
jgi:hypothetical protein